MSAPGHKQKAKEGSRSDWETPRELFDLLDKRLHFTLDGAANWNNTKCAVFYSEEKDAFKQDPRGETIWCNPPFGRDLIRWIDLFNKWSEYNKVVILTPSNTDTKWWEKAHYAADETVLLTGRVPFVSPVTGEPCRDNPSGSCLFLWNTCFNGHIHDRIWLWDWKATLA